MTFSRGLMLSGNFKELRYCHIEDWEGRQIAVLFGVR